MKFSIITPSFNHAQFIERTISSVLNQKDVELEYIIIDGKSTDNTLNIIRDYDAQLIWVSEKDNGQSDAINKGLKLATGEIVAFLNSDDVYCPGAFQQVAEFFKNNPDKMWVYGKCKIIDENDQEIRKPITWYKNFMLKKYSYSKLLQENFISQPATFWRRELITEIGLLDKNEHLCMDYEYWLRIGCKYDAGVINEYLASFRFYAKSKSGANFTKQFKDELRLALKYGSKYPFSLLIHRFNYYKITWIYKLMRIFK